MIDQYPAQHGRPLTHERTSHATVAVVGILLVAGTAGDCWRAQALQNEATAAAAPVPRRRSGWGGLERVASRRPRPGIGSATKLGDLSQFRTITQDTRDLLDRGDQSGATAHTTDLETAWDDAQARLKPRDPAASTTVYGKIDTVLRELRSTSPNAASEKTALDALLAH